jgi:hypothetical protein
MAAAGAAGITRVFPDLSADLLRLREIPEIMRYYHRIRRGDRADWVCGILFSDVIGKHFYRAFGVNQAPADPLFGGLAARILQDESRHLAFAEHYLRRNVAGMEPARRRALIEMRDDLFRILQQSGRAQVLDSVRWVCRCRCKNMAGDTLSWGYAVPISLSDYEERRAGRLRGS